MAELGFHTILHQGITCSILTCGYLWQLHLYDENTIKTDHKQTKRDNVLNAAYPVGSSHGLFQTFSRPGSQSQEDLFQFRFVSSIKTKTQSDQNYLICGLSVSVMPLPDFPLGSCHNCCSHWRALVNTTLWALAFWNDKWKNIYSLNMCLFCITVSDWVLNSLSRD